MVFELLDIFFLILSFYLLKDLKSKNTQLSLRIIFGLILGTVYGFLLKIVPNDLLLTIVKNLLYFVGHAYLALLKMLVIPLILTSIIHAILNLGSDNGSYVKKISFISVGMLLGMTSLASLIGLLIGKVFDVGKGLKIPEIAAMPAHAYKGFVETLLGMLPSNPAAVLVQENTIAVVLLAVFFGVAARKLDVADHDKMNTFRQFIASLFAIVKSLAKLILDLTPYGIFALISLLLFEQGIAILWSLLNFIMAMYVAMCLVFLMHLTILIFFRISPWKYLKRAINPLFVAFTTRSSFGTLPITEETLRDNFKTNQVIATFVPSIGASIGMNACAGIFPAMLVVMTLTIMQQPLTVNTVLMVMFINAVASLGISGIPGTAYIAATITLTSLNLPYAIVALVQGIDPIIDMGRTATNVNGVMTTALVVDHLDKMPAELHRK